MNKIIPIVIALVLNNISGIAQNSNTEPNINAIIDSMLYSKDNGFAGSKNIIGASVGVYWQGKTYYYSYGYANREKKIKVDSNTIFEIGSNTKVFTGLLFSEEISKKRMDGNDYIDKYVEVNDNIKNKVRLIDIANHMSGLPTFHDSESLAELINKDTSKDPLMMITDDYMLSVLKRVDSLHAYGKYNYSNFGFGLLGYILQKESGFTYDKLLRKDICLPLNLPHTFATSDTNNRNMANGYIIGERAPFINLCKAMQGAGAIKSNITDMMTFIKFQLNGNAQLNDALEISQRKYYNSENLKIAMGWHIGEIYNAEIYEMRGDTYGASSVMLFDKAHKFGFVLLLNSANSGVTQRSMSTFLAKVLDNTSDFQKRFNEPEIQISNEILNKYKGTYELEPGFDGEVTIDGGTLSLQLTGQPKGKFKSVENNWFTMEKYNCQLEFVLNDKGECNEMIIHQNGQDITCKRK
jgi:CubicO group peptidase (beta-lactamase class C family)